MRMANKRRSMVGRPDFTPERPLSAPYPSMQSCVWGEENNRAPAHGLQAAAALLHPLVIDMRRLGVSGTTITNFCRDGMPYRVSDGKVCWPDVLYWADWNRRPSDSHNWYSLHRCSDRVKRQTEQRARELRRPAAEAWVRARRQGIDTTSAANRAIMRATRLSGQITSDPRAAFQP
jgi:hypothetical protein